MAPLQRLTPGQPIDGLSAGTWNALVAHLAGHQPDRPRQNEKLLTNGARLPILIRNSTGADLQPYQVVGMTSPVITPSQNLPVFQQAFVLDAQIPTADDVGRFAITQAAIPDGEVGPAVIAGAMPVSLDVTNTAHEFADAIAGDVTKLRSGETGAARIIWKESGTGTKYGIVYFPLGSSSSGDGSGECCVEVPIDITHQGWSYQNLGGDWEHDTNEYGAFVAGVKFRSPSLAFDIDMVGWIMLHFEINSSSMAYAKLKMPARPGTGPWTGALPGFPIWPPVYEQRIEPHILANVYAARGNTGALDTIPFGSSGAPWLGPTVGLYNGPTPITLRGTSESSANITAIVNDVLNHPTWSSGDFLTLLIVPKVDNFTTGPPWDPNYWSAWVGDFIGSDVNDDGLSRASLVYA